MAKETKHQLNLGINIQLGKGGRNIGQQIAQSVAKELPPALTKAIGQQIAQWVAKELTPALTKAIEQAFSKAQGQVRRTTKQTADVAAKDHIKAAELAARQKKQAEDFERRAAQIERTRRTAGISYEAAVMEERRRETRARETAETREARDAERLTQRRSRLQERYEAAVQDEVRQRDRKKDQAQRQQDIATDRRRRLERDYQLAVQGEHAQRLRGRQREAVQTERAEERAAERAFDMRMRAMRRDAARVRRAEREIGRLEGDPAVEIADLEAAGGRIGRADVGRRLVHARRLAGLFPGASRIARATGLPIGLVRGAMSLGSLIGGVATGNVFGGAAGGGGAQLGGLLGIGGVAGGVLAGGGALLGVLGALGVRGMRDASAQVQRAIQFSRAMQPQLAQMAPTMQPLAEDIIRRQREIARGGAKVGLTPEEALSIMTRVGSFRGGTGSVRSQVVQQEALQLHQAFGITPETIRQLELARDRGGLVGVAGMPMSAQTIARSMAERAIGLGFQPHEIADFVGQQAQLATQAREQGTFFNQMTFGQTVGGLAPAIGQIQGARVAGGLTGALQGVAGQGIAGAPNPALGLMMLQAFGGLNIGQKGGVSAADILAAQEQIEREGVTPQGMRRMMDFLGQAAGGSQALQIMMAQRVFGQLGIAMGPGLMRSKIAGGPTGPMAADIAATITGADEAQRELAAFQAGGGLRGRGRAVVPPEVAEEARIEGQRLEAGFRALPGAQALDKAMADLAFGFSDLASTVDMLKNQLMRLVVP
jgi:hypothetical protein